MFLIVMTEVLTWEIVSLSLMMNIVSHMLVDIRSESLTTIVITLPAMTWNFEFGYIRIFEQ